MPHDAGPAETADFASAELSLKLQQSRVGAWLMLALIPAGISLDYFVYHDRLLEFTGYRLLADVVVVGAIVLHTSRIASRWPYALIALWLGAAIVMICGMIYTTEGAISTYYAGLVLSLLAIGILLPLTVVEAVWMCAVTLALYCASCLLHDPNGLRSPIFFNNIYFLVLASIICVTAVHFGTRRRLRDFELRRELELRNRQMTELDRVKSAFFANVSHELRTPLTLILGPTQELMAAAPPDSTTRRSLDIVERSALRLLRLVNDLLDLVRFEHGRSVVEREPVDLARLLAGLVEQMRQLANRQNLELAAHIEPEWLGIVGDPAAIERAFINLISNAIKFTPAGGRVEVRAFAEGDKAIVEIRDTGIGIADQDQDLIFDRFHQVATPASRGNQGLGIGLALVKEIVERHGGTIAVDSRLGHGTTMTLRFDLSEQNVPGANAAAAEPRDDIAALYRQAALSEFTQPATEAAPASQDDGTTGADRPTIVIIDDEPDMQRFLLHMLQDEYRVCQAYDGKAGLEMVKSEQPDVVLLDLMLPGMSGIDVCKCLKEDAALARIKVVMLTASVDENAKLDALRLGADDYLTKPFSSIEVQTRLRNLQTSARLERDLNQRNSELVEALRKLRTAEAQLLHSEKLTALGTMAAGLLHEINNPINFANTALQVIKRNRAFREDADIKEILSDIEDGFNRIQAIVTDLSVFATPSRADSHRPFRFAASLKNALRFTATQLSGIEVEQNLDPEDLVVGNESQLVQVLVNLLLNAARAARESASGSPRITITTLVHGKRLGVTVHDNGSGISTDRISRIFDPFYTTHDVGKGMGLGLSISHGIIASHGGSLKVRSEVGSFSEFSFDLSLVGPVKKASYDHAVTH